MSLFCPNRPQQQQTRRKKTPKNGQRGIYVGHQGLQDLQPKQRHLKHSQIKDLGRDIVTWQCVKSKTKSSDLRHDYWLLCLFVWVVIDTWTREILDLVQVPPPSHYSLLYQSEKYILRVHHIEKRRWSTSRFIEKFYSEFHEDRVVFECFQFLNCLVNISVLSLYKSVPCQQNSTKPHLSGWKFFQIVESCRHRTAW